jgi:hypothetical protein
MPTFKFKVGDLVIGNGDANYYLKTRQGWIGKVTNFGPHGFDAVRNQAYVQGGAGDLYTNLDYDKFDLLKKAKQPKAKCSASSNTVAVDKEFIKDLYRKADNSTSEVIKTKFPELFESEYFEFEPGQTLQSGYGDLPVMIGIGAVPQEMKYKALVVSSKYEPEIITKKGGTKYITFKKK